jgi:hypothetical protein
MQINVNGQNVNNQISADPNNLGTPNFHDIEKIKITKHNAIFGYNWEAEDKSLWPKYESSKIVVGEHNNNTNTMKYTQITAFHDTLALQK